MASASDEGSTAGARAPLGLIASTVRNQADSGLRSGVPSRMAPIPTWFDAIKKRLKEVEQLLRAGPPLSENGTRRSFELIEETVALAADLQREADRP
jgi:hypothetical protein